MKERQIFSYLLSGDFNREEAIIEIRKITGVVEASIEENVLKYEIDSRIGEYDVMRASMDIIEKLGGEFDFSEQADTELPTELPEEVVSEIAAEAETLEQPEAKAEVPLDYLEEDDLEYAKKVTKSDIISKAVELGLALILYVASLFVVSTATDTFFTPTNLMLIFAFALAASESIFFNAVTALAKKQFFNESVIMSIVSLLGVLFSFLSETTLVVLVFALVKNIQALSEAISYRKVTAAFYCGQPQVKLVKDDKLIAVGSVKAGDVLEFSEGAVISIDGTCDREVELDGYRLDKGVYKAAANEKIYAGSVLLSASVKLTASCKQSENEIVKRKESFEANAKKLEYKPFKWVKYVTIGVIVAALALLFILAAFNDNYYLGLRSWSLRFIPVIALSAFLYPFSLLTLNLYNSAVAAKANNLYIEDAAAFARLGSANTIKIDASVLCTNGKVQQDAIGAMKELKSYGVKNIITVFDKTSLKNEEREKIDFVETPVKKEKLAVIAYKDGDLSIHGEGLHLESDSVRSIPKAYLAAKRFAKAKLGIIILSIISLLCLPLALVVPSSENFVSIFFAPIAFALWSIAAAFTLLPLKSK